MNHSPTLRGGNGSDRVRIDEITYTDSQSAFERAIAGGRLSTSESSPLYAGRWMYMGTWRGNDHFKSIDTREYLAVQS